MGARLSFLSRLVAEDRTSDAAQLQSEVERCAAVRLCDVRSGSVATVTGRLRSVVYVPTDNAPTLRAELFDGSAVIDLIWLGRRRVAGIEPGRSMTARGRIGVHDGSLAMYNPWYELRPSE